MCITRRWAVNGVSSAQPINPGQTALGPFGALPGRVVSCALLLVPTLDLTPDLCNQMLTACRTAPTAPCRQRLVASDTGADVAAGLLGSIAATIMVQLSGTTFGHDIKQRCSGVQGLCMHAFL